MPRMFIITLILVSQLIGHMPLQAQDTPLDCLATPNGAGCMAGLPAAQYQMLLDEMALNARPDVDFLPVNEEEVYRFAFRRLNNPNGTQIFNAPDGVPTGEMAPGFAFVTVFGYQPGWVMINNNQWVREADTQVISPSTFSGAQLDAADLRYPMAWMLLPTRPSPYPGAEADPERPRIDRYTPVNIFATVEVDGWRWYLVGPDSWIQQTNVAKILFTERPEGVKGRWIAVDLYEQVVVAYEEDTPVFASLVSSGLSEWPTNEGTFQTWARFVNAPMDGAEGRVDFYSLQNVPYILYYDGSFALHAAYWHDGFGYRHSHGCINLSITDAHWLYDWTLEGGYEYPYVHIFSSGEYVE